MVLLGPKAASAHQLLVGCNPAQPPHRDACAQLQPLVPRGARVPAPWSTIIQGKHPGGKSERVPASEHRPKGTGSPVSHAELSSTETGHRCREGHRASEAGAPWASQDAPLQLRGCRNTWFHTKHQSSPCSLGLLKVFAHH